MRRAADAAGPRVALAALGGGAGRALPRAPLAVPARHAPVPLHRRPRLPAQPEAAVTVPPPPAVLQAAVASMPGLLRPYPTRHRCCLLGAGWARSGRLMSERVPLPEHSPAPRQAACVQTAKVKWWPFYGVLVIALEQMGLDVV